MNGAAPHQSALLDVDASALPDTAKRGLLVPRMTEAQRNDIGNPSESLLIYNTTSKCFNYWSAGVWFDLCGNRDKPRMLGYGGGVGNGARVVPINTYQDCDVRVMCSTSELFVELVGQNLQYRQMSLDWNTELSTPSSVIVVDSFLYVLVKSTTVFPYEWRVYRYDLGDIATGGTMMTFVGGTTLVSSSNDLVMTASGNGLFYFNYNAGNSTSDFVIAKYSVSGTSLVYLASTSFGSTIDSFNRIVVDVSGNLYGVSAAGTDVVRKFNSAGTLLYTTPPYVLGSATTRVLNWQDTFYFGDSAVDRVLNRVYLE